MAKKDFGYDSPVVATSEGKKTSVVDVMSGVNYPVSVKYNGEEYLLSPSTGLKGVDEAKVSKPLPMGVYLVRRNS